MTTTAATDGTDSPIWRLGNHNPHNLYFGDKHVGMLINSRLAAKIVQVMNNGYGNDLAEVNERVRASMGEGWRAEIFTTRVGLPAPSEPDGIPPVSRWDEER